MLKIHWVNTLADIRLKNYKVTATGKGSLRITIPKIVANTWGLKHGDKLNMIFRDAKELIIYREESETSDNQ